MPTDEELLAAVARGEASALQALYGRHERAVFRFLARFSGGRDADDLAQETWLRVVRGAGRFTPGRRFSPWLFQIALNVARDWHRRRPPEPVDPDTVSNVPAADRLRAVDAALDARRLLAMLPEAQRAAVILRYYQDLPEDEVAEILGCPRGTVKSRLHHAMARLAACVRDDR